MMRKTPFWIVLVFAATALVTSASASPPGCSHSSSIVCVNAAIPATSGQFAIASNMGALYAMTPGTETTPPTSIGNVAFMDPHNLASATTPLRLVGNVAIGTSENNTTMATNTGLAVTSAVSTNMDMDTLALEVQVPLKISLNTNTDIK